MGIPKPPKRVGILIIDSNRRNEFRVDFSPNDGFNSYSLFGI